MPTLSVGVGIGTGPAFVGNIQSSDRFIWTVIGDTVNLAARLQSAGPALRCVRHRAAGLRQVLQRVRHHVGGTPTAARKHPNN
jgi:hypothetical protein